MSKAQVFSISLMFELIFSIVLLITFFWLLFGGFTSINQVSNENENERHALALANAFSSNANVTYFDGNQFHRDTLDKGKIDKLMTSKDDFINDWEAKIYPNVELSKNFSYPDSYSVIIVLDLESGNAWITSLSGISRFNIDDFIDCLKENIKGSDIPKLFELNSNLHEILKIEECSNSMYSLIDYGFPVAIEYDYNDIHSGLVRVLVVEWEKA